MENLLRGIPQVIVYIDDVLIMGDNEEEHLSTLYAVLTRLQESGLRLKRGKCTFLAPSVEYLGYRVDKQGLHPTNEKVKAIEEAPAPKNITQLKAYLWLLSYYSIFLPHLPSILAPLYKLLHKNKEWEWSKDQNEAFCKSKALLTTENVLTHYKTNVDLTLACDASMEQCCHTDLKMAQKSL